VLWRGSGLLLREWITRSRERDPYCFGWWWRCVSCGNRLDGAILRNRTEHAAETAFRRQAMARDLKDWAAWFQKMPVPAVTAISASSPP
jgi:hypothetical protein